MVSPWIDVSVTLRSGMVTWPGDPPPRIDHVLDMEKGDRCTISRLDMGAHTGTHMDAPAHFVRGGRGIDTMPLDAAVGPARVIAIRDRESIKPDELLRHRIRRGERLLFKTRNSARCWDADSFVEDFVYISAAAAQYLAERRVRLVGIDYLSVGSPREDGVNTHRVLLTAGIWIIEGLNLARVKPGRVQLVCLPIKIAGADGAPSRALVRQTGRVAGKKH